MSDAKEKKDLYSIDTSDTCFEGAGYPEANAKWIMAHMPSAMKALYKERGLYKDEWDAWDATPESR